MNKVLIVGRPNVGKSSLFNRLIKKKKALVINQPGVTRDILKQKCSWWGGTFEVWDSGGLWAKGSPWSQLINVQVQSAVSKVNMVLLVMSARSGFQDEDKTVFRLIKKSGCPFLILINKVDEVKNTHALLSDFRGLGAELLPCAFEQGRGVPEIVEWILSQISKESRSKVGAPSNNTPRVLGTALRAKNRAPSINTLCVLPRPRGEPGVLLVGKTNVGKSTLSNALLGQERSLVSPRPGTTLDIVEERFTYNSYVYSLCDTAGFVGGAKKSKLESLSNLKTTQSFKTANLILLLLEGPNGPDRATARILNLCVEEYKPTILVVNKWDKVYTLRKEEYRKTIQQKFSFYPDLPVVFVSALKEQGLHALMQKVEEMYQKSYFQVSTSELNRFWTQVIRKAPSPVYGTQNVKFYYITQTQQVPPTFIAFANYPEGVRPSYKRFLMKQIQKKWNLKGVPVRLSILPRNQRI